MTDLAKLAASLSKVWLKMFPDWRRPTDEEFQRKIIARHQVLRAYLEQNP